MSDNTQPRSGQASDVPDPVQFNPDAEASRLAKNAQALGGEDHMAAADEMFRNQMRQSDDPQAKQWVQLDSQAQQGERALSKDQTDKDRRLNSGSQLQEAEQQLDVARNTRDEHMAQGRPVFYDRDGRAEYDARLKSMNGEIATTQKSFTETVKQSSTEEITKLQERIEQRQQGLDSTVADRQGIAKLPSEHAQAEQQGQGLSMHERIAQSRQAWTPADDAQSQGQQGNGQGQVQGQSAQQPDGTEAGQRVRPNYAAMNETNEDRAFAKQLEADQAAAHQHYGHLPNDKEMKEFIGQREQQEANNQGQQTQGQDKFAQNLQQRRGQSQSQ